MPPAIGFAIILRIGERKTFRVSPRAANRQYSGGSPPGAGLTAATADAVATAAASGSEAPAVDVVGVAAGTSQLTLGFDGITRTFTVSVQ